ncbi:MAG TPA: NAD-dependent epimerase/dehydratase family protein, partial [Thermoanaerobaculia bacterium]|nr:NAD-dependent epimerase/dehydratase family protein [Thermoanaerobaculia bacterium]
MSQRLAFLTGGTGFLGGHVARALSADGWAVRALTRRTSGFPPDLSLDAVAGDLLDGSQDA